MRIIHELNQLDYGGVERVIKNIAKFDKINEHTVLAYKDGPFKKELEKEKINFIIAPEKGETSFDADLVHIHCGGDTSSLATAVGKAFPVVETIHSPVRSPVSGDFIKKRVGVTRAVTLMNTNCETIYNGLDLSEIEPTKSKEEVKKELGIPEGVPVVGRLGRIAPDKCVEEWLVTCNRLQMQGVDFVPLVVGGEPSTGSGRYLGRLKLIAESLPVNKIKWTGHKSDVANYLQIMDVFLYPSPTEGFGLVFAEAMYNEAVVVTYKNDVTMEVLGGYAVLTENNVNALAEGVKFALTNQQTRDDLISLGMQYVETDLNAERMTSQYQELYKRVAS